MRSPLLFFIRAYQRVLRPMMGTGAPTCRFYPSCSCYAHQAIERHGSWRGAGMAIKRILRCHPWNDGGYDPVEPASSSSHSTQHSSSTSRLT